MRLNACFNEMALFAALIKGCSSYDRNGGQPQKEMGNPQGMKVFVVERNGLPEDFTTHHVFRSFAMMCERGE